MHEFNNLSDVTFLQYFCQHGNTILGVILGVGLLAVGIYKLNEFRKRK